MKCNLHTSQWVTVIESKNPVAGDQRTSSHQLSLLPSTQPLKKMGKGAFLRAKANLWKALYSEREENIGARKAGADRQGRERNPEMVSLYLEVHFPVPLVPQWSLTHNAAFHLSEKKRGSRHWQMLSHIRVTSCTWSLAPGGAELCDGQISWCCWKNPVPTCVGLWNPGCFEMFSVDMEMVDFPWETAWKLEQG